MNDKKPRPPQGLARRGAAFWRRATAERPGLSETELELLAECCWLLDECEALRLIVDEEGTRVPGSAGQPRVHPALGELRQHRLALGRLLAQLALKDEDGNSLATPYTARGRAGAEARWSHSPSLERARRRTARERLGTLAAERDGA